MKAFHYLLPMACIALAACSSSEVTEDPETQGTAITFDTHMWKNSRALSNANFKQFYVYGTYRVSESTVPVQVFGGDAVNYNKDTDTWTYSSADRYWNPKGTYDFYAYSCENTTLGNANGSASFHNTSTESHLDITDYLISSTHCTHDLVYAKLTEQAGSAHTSATSSTPVALDFKHLLTRVKFTIESEFPDNNNRVTISNVTLRNFRDKGDFHGNDLEWVNVEHSNASDQPAIVVKSEATVIQENATHTTLETDPVYMIPFKYAEANVYLQFEVNVQAKDTNGAWEDVLGQTIIAHWAPNWEMGKSLNNHIKLNSSASGLEKITFTAKIVPDGPDTDSDGWSDFGDGGLSGLGFEVAGRGN